MKIIKSLQRIVMFVIIKMEFVEDNSYKINLLSK